MTQLLNHWGWSGGDRGAGASSRYDKAVRDSQNLLFKLLSLNLSTRYPSSIFCSDDKTKRYKATSTFNNEIIFKGLFVNKKKLQGDNAIRDFLAPTGLSQGAPVEVSDGSTATGVLLMED